LPNKEEELATAIKNATRLHGHLGPFLVIGVRMGKLAKTTLTNIEENQLRATAKVPLLTPFSCILDGIQATTSCTIGNQKLHLENSKKEITVRFECQNSGKTIKVTVNPTIVEKLMNRIAEGTSNEELAREIAHMPETQLFKIEKQQMLWTASPSLSETNLLDLETAKKRLDEKSLTLSIVKNCKIIFETASHGVSGFLEAIETVGDQLEEASIADRIVGKAIAFLCVYAKVKAVYTVILSKEAKAVFEKNMMYHEWDSLVENILNINKTGICPFEKLAKEISNPNSAYRKLKALQNSLKNDR
jgi:formylmethanofuran dehydrogenase subunit E